MQRVLAVLARLCATHPGVHRLLVGFSGGHDSSALLDWLAVHRAHLPGLALAAVHVDHGWRAASADWARDCAARATALGVPCELIAVDGRATPGDSPEAAARRARYAALAERVDTRTALLTAHHQDDQAETVLLQLLRGAGPAGLAAMSGDAPLGTGRHWRPLLDCPRDVLRHWTLARGLTWIEDPANVDARFDRSYLRQHIMPALLARWPAAGRTLARAARLCAEAAEAVDAQAAADLAAAGAGATLPVTALLALPDARARAALRAWVRARGLPLPAAAQLDAIVHGVLAARPDAAPCVRWPGAELHRFRGALHAFAPRPAPDPALCLPWPDGGRAPLVLPDGSLLVWRPAVGAGVRTALLDAGALAVRGRRAGERFRPTGRAHAQALKKLLQEAGVPPWERARLPLVTLDDMLLVVPGIGVAAGFAAAAEQPGRALEWQSRAHSATIAALPMDPLEAPYSVGLDR